MEPVSEREMNNKIGARAIGKAAHAAERILVSVEIPKRRAPLSGLRRLLAARSGTSVVEFAVAAPVLLGLLVPVADLGVAFAQRVEVQQAVQAGAQYAAFHPWSTSAPSDISNAVLAASPLGSISVTPAPYQACGCPSGSTITAATCTSTCANGETAGYYVVITAQAPYSPMLPYSALGDSVLLTGQSTVRIR
jgi:Flp pilus assembly protein TadG